jgi:hypothetical protein
LLALVVIGWHWWSLVVIGCHWLLVVGWNLIFVIWIFGFEICYFGFGVWDLLFIEEAISRKNCIVGKKCKQLKNGTRILRQAQFE